MTYSIMIIAGEASGDFHASTLIQSLIHDQPLQPYTNQTSDSSVSRSPTPSTTEIGAPNCASSSTEALTFLPQNSLYTFYGIAGDQAKGQGMRLIQHYRILSTMGIFETLSTLPTLARTLRQIKSELNTRPPSLLILIDFAGFNLKVARHAKSRGIKVLYYIPPKIWASRPRRIEKLKRFVDHIAVILPFEQALYDKHHIPTSYVGNGLVDKARRFRQPRAISNLHPPTNRISLMPGSRHGEIKRILPRLVTLCERLRQTHPALRFDIIVAPAIDTLYLSQFCQHSPVTFNFVSDAYTAITASDLVVAASGTATLEVALLHTPLIVVYNLSPMTYWIAKMLVHLSDYSLCNILAGKRIVPELIQKQCKPTPLTHAVTALLDNPSLRQKMSEDMKILSDSLESHTTTPFSQCIHTLLS